MLFTPFIVAVTLLANPTSAPSTTSSCFGPCYIPGCPNSTFYICHETPGSTTVYAENGGAKVTGTWPNDSTGQQTILGGQVTPAPGETWGSVSSCGDVYGGC